MTYYPFNHKFMRSICGLAPLGIQGLEIIPKSLTWKLISKSSVLESMCLMLHYPSCTRDTVFIYSLCVCVCVCVNSYADPSPGRYAGSHYLVLLYISAYMNHYFPTNLEPRHGLWWPMCLVLRSAARWRAALKPLRCLCEVQYCA